MFFPICFSNQCSLSVTPQAARRGRGTQRWRLKIALLWSLPAIMGLKSIPSATPKCNKMRNVSRITLLTRQKEKQSHHQKQQTSFFVQGNSWCRHRQTTPEKHICSLVMPNTTPGFKCTTSLVSPAACIVNESTWVICWFKLHEVVVGNLSTVWWGWIGRRMKIYIFYAVDGSQSILGNLLNHWCVWRCKPICWLPHSHRGACLLPHIGTNWPARHNNNTVILKFSTAGVNHVLCRVVLCLYVVVPGDGSAGGTYANSPLAWCYTGQRLNTADSGLLHQCKSVCSVAVYLRLPRFLLKYNASDCYQSHIWSAEQFFLY